MATIELQESLVNRLLVQAQAKGLTLEAYLERLAALPFLDGGKLPRLTAEELERLLDSEASEVTTYRGSYSRADIYLDHD